ncbi:MAG: nucleotidyltransferase domain-containing protein, partial [Actinomycetota bacterium]|nr:nucleotidyltransferase domain-containing protein [Actinomycetota bacterium]
MQKAIFLNKEKVIEDLKKLATEAKKKDKNIKKVVLFGSLVKNTFTAFSDADLLIVLKDSKVRFIDRIPHFLFLFLDAPIPVDVFP